MWSRKAGPPYAGWTQDRVIELEGLLPVDAVWSSPYVAGFAEGIGVVFVTANDVLFTIDLKTYEVKKVCEGRGIRVVVPYMSFDTPVLGELVQIRDQVRAAQVHKKCKLLM